MYSPHSDLHKMFYTPEFIVFRADIKGQQFLGRPTTLHIDHPWVPGRNQQAVFQTFSSVQSYLAGYIDLEIPVTSMDIKGIEAIDTIDPDPLNKILAACNDINNIKDIPDVGILWRNIAPLLDNLVRSLEAYEDIHGQARYEKVYDDIEDIRNECMRCPANLSDNSRAGIARNMKEKISFDVTRLIEMGSYIQLT